ncbi:LemA family protein [Elioraea rosea]|uniref:LemA family protein n=1 Tax=Elioraea rosea TaxID=2492390 RepID=UPI001EF3D7E3|nr:LemA family protein [Elioraea rosea]
MSAFSVVAIAVLALAAAVIGYVIVTYNALVRGRTMVEEGWSGIDVQLQRRADLVPPLVDVVRAHAAHERGIFEEIAEKRAAAMSARGREDRAAAEQGLTGALGRLFALAEAYPTLTADKSFLNLQQNLSEVENTLQDARRYYNATVRDQNVRVQSFPSSLVASGFGFGTASFFDAGPDEALRRPPRIALGGPGGIPGA